MDILYHTPAVRAGENRMLKLDLNHASNGKDSIVTHDQKRSSRRVLVMTMRSNNHDLRIAEICALILGRRRRVTHILGLSCRSREEEAKGSNHHRGEDATLLREITIEEKQIKLRKKRLNPTA